MNKKRGAVPGPSLHGLLHTAAMAQLHVEAQLGEIGLSMAKLAALEVLTQSGDQLPLGQLAERLACVKSNITQLVDRLEADGLVARQAAPGDRRTRLAVITAAGKKAWKEGSAIQKRGERELFSRMKASEARQFAALMEKVATKP